MATYSGTPNADNNSTVAGGYSTGADTISGQAGNDTLWGDGNTGNTTLGGNDQINGNVGNDVLFGGRGGDTLNGNEDNDTLFGGMVTQNGGVVSNLSDLTQLTYLDDAIRDTLVGGTGNDVYYIFGSDSVSETSTTGGADTIILLSTSGVTAYTVATNVETFQVGLGTPSEVTASAFTANLNITGNVSANFLHGTGGNNVISGGTGADSLYGYSGNDTLYGATFNGTSTYTSDTTAVDRLFGGLGDDTYIVHGADSVDVISENANEGTDRIVLLSARSAGVLMASSVHVENFQAGTAAATEASADTITFAQNITGNDRDNQIWGTGNTNTIAGGIGNDSINSAAGNDTIKGEVGNDSLIGGKGADSLEGGDDNDTLYGGSYVVATNTYTSDTTSVDNLTGGAGSDTYVLTGSDTVDVINEAVGATGTDRIALVGSAALTSFNMLTKAAQVENFQIGLGNTTAEKLDKSNAMSINLNVTGNTLDNEIWGTAGLNNIGGGDGADTLYGGAGADTLRGEAGADYLYGGIGADSLEGGTEADLLQGDAGSDTLSGGEGNDELYGDSSEGLSYIDDGLADTLKGGAGDDTYYLNHARDVVDESAAALGAGVDKVIWVGGVAGSYAMTDGIENFTVATFSSGSANVNLDITGNTLANDIRGSAGSNNIGGGVGNDTLYGGAGTDTLRGDADADELRGGSGADSLDGGGADDLLMGEEGGDTLVGGEGADALYGDIVSASFTYVDDGMADTLRGGAGDDAYYLNHSRDVVDESTAALGSGVDKVFWVGSTADTYDLTEGVEKFAVMLFGSGAANVNLVINGNVLGNELLGSNGSNDIKGNDGDDTLRGLGGNDTLDGGSGTNNMDGGAGSDTYHMRSATDVISDSGSLVGDVDTLITHFSDVQLDGSLENLTLSSEGGSEMPLYAYGNSQGNVITGNAGDNVLTGQDGADQLVGGLGNDELIAGSYDIYEDVYISDLAADTLVGGAGADTYFVDGSQDVIVEEANDVANNRDVILLIDTVTGGVPAGTSYNMADHVEDLAVGTYFGLSPDAAGISFNLDVNGNAGNNKIFGTAGINRLNGGEGNDSLRGWRGNDTLRGGLGNDTLIGGLDVDDMDGGGGSDFYYVDHISDTTTDTGTGEYDVDTVSSSISLTTAVHVSIEKIILTGTAISALGNSANNIMEGNTQNNVLRGGIGIDVLSGGDGHDTLYGNDVTLNDVSTDYLYGDAGNDKLYGSIGVDVLDGGSGIDTMEGGNGDDTYYLDSLLDVVTESSDAIDGGWDKVVWSTSDDLLVMADFVEEVEVSAPASDATYQVQGNDQTNLMWGSDSNDILDGANGNDTLVGQQGNDVLIGGLGADLMIGGEGDDTFYVDDQGDEVQEIDAEFGGVDTVMLHVLNSPWTLSSSVENVQIMAVSADERHEVVGNELNNTIWGSEATDVMTGGAGNDTLFGGFGNDEYHYQRGDGSDTIYEQRDDWALADTGGDLSFTGVTWNQMWFSRVSGTDDLLIQVMGTPNDNVTVANWFASEGSQLNRIVDKDFGAVLTNNQVDALVAKMATFAAPAASLQSLPLGEGLAVAAYWAPLA